MYVWQKYEDVKGTKNLFSHVTCATDTAQWAQKGGQTQFRDWAMGSR